MIWFRSNIRLGVRLALAALLVQFALSFGHSHGFTPSPLLQSALQSADGQRAALDQKSPAGSDRDRGDDNCAICGVMAMANTIVFATPPLLPPPQASEPADPGSDADFALLQAAGQAFRARAPPLS